MSRTLIPHEIRTIIFILIFANISVITSAQDALPIVKENAIWNVSNVNFALNPWDDDTFSTTSYRIFGDTVINLTEYKKLWTVNCFDDYFIEENSEFYLPIRESEQKVYLLIDGDEKCIYDFTLGLNDTVEHYSLYFGQSFELIVESIDTVIINDVSRKVYSFTASSSLPGWIKPWIEGIGSEAGLIECIYPYGNFEVYLNCYKEDNEIVYSLMGDNCCIGLINALNNNNVGNIDIFPNPTSNEFYIDIPLELLPADFHLYSVDGKLLLKEEINQTRQQISTENLPPGTYSYSIKRTNYCESGKIILIQ